MLKTEHSPLDALESYTEQASQTLHLAKRPTHFEQLPKRSGHSFRFAFERGLAVVRCPQLEEAAVLEQQIRALEELRAHVLSPPPPVSQPEDLRAEAERFRDKVRRTTSELP